MLKREGHHAGTVEVQRLLSSCKRGRFERGAPHGRGYALSLGSKYEGRTNSHPWTRAEEECSELLLIVSGTHG